MIKRLLNLRGLFSNTKFLIAFSIILAFIFWVVVALEFTPITETTIKGIPITIELEGTTAKLNDFECFNEAEFKVDITIEGKRYEIGGDKITADDFTAVAYATYVNSAGQNALAVEVKPKNNDAEFKIVGQSADYINVYLDKRVEESFEVNFDIAHEKEGTIAAEGYYFDRDSISFYNNLTLSGPKTQIDKIRNITLELNPGVNLKKNVEVKGNLSFETNSGEKLTDDDLKFIKISNMSYDEFIKLNVESVKVPIYKIVKVKPVINVTDIPEKYDNDKLIVSVDPENVKVAIPVADASGDSAESLEMSISYSAFSSDGTYDFEPQKIDDVIWLDGFEIAINFNDSSTESLSIMLPIQPTW